MDSQRELLSKAVAYIAEHQVCSHNHVLTIENIVIERRQGKPKFRCRTCRQKSWRNNAARRNKLGLHT